ncbi:MAG: hypothetical protein NZ481_07090 [Candidatus Kapabacteria bacterium]|nr:hypothetical protein [Candidatus Kapabacteria bacterium]
MTTPLLHNQRSFLERLLDAPVLTVDGPCRGAVNMERDVALAQALLESPEDDRVHVRLYAWQPWCISLGHTQPESDIARERAEADGIELVRRPTGGRAILHAQELTYAFALRLRDGLTPSLVYQQWHLWLAEVLRRSFEVEGITIARVQSDFPLLYRRAPTRWLCFASSARTELLWRGRKLVGSAQRLYGEVLLQHGSLLLGSGHQRLPFYLRECPEPESVAAYLAQRSVTLSEICQRAVSFDEVCDAIRCGLRSPPV